MPSDNGLQVEREGKKKTKKENYKPKMNLKGKNSVKSQKPVKETQIQWSPWCKGSDDEENLTGSCKCAQKPTRERESNRVCLT